MSRCASNRAENLPLIDQLERRVLLSAVYPNAYEQYLLQIINRARADPNAEASRLGTDLNEGIDPDGSGTISSAAKQPLAFNPSLVDAATKHSQWMLDNNTFSGDEGDADVLAQETAAGYPVGTVGGSLSQNIVAVPVNAIPQDLTGVMDQMEEMLFVDSSDSSRDDRENLMDPGFREIGIGTASGTFTVPGGPQGPTVLGTEDFGFVANNTTFVTGVAYRDSDNNQFYTPGEGLGGITITATNMDNGGVFSTQTWASGGYSLPLKAGSYHITASGPGLGAAQSQDVDVTGQNAKLDFLAGALPALPPGVTASADAAYAFDNNVLTLAGGTLTFSQDLPAGDIAVNGSGPTSHVVFNTTEHLAALTLTGGAEAVINSVGAGRSAGTQYVLVLGSLSVDSTSRLDLADNDAIIHNGSASDILSQLIAGRGVPVGGTLDGTWAGTHGITSSTAQARDAADGLETVGIGWAVNSTLPLGAFQMFDGQTVTGTDVLLKYTYTGDATLDGIVDDNDVTVIGLLYDGGATTGHTDAEGDFNFDGKVDDTDVTILGLIYGNGTKGSGMPPL